MSERHTLVLEGCTIEPLGCYLKSVALLRLVGSQVDRDATGHWDGDEFVLMSTLDRDALVSFLLDEYVPTPVLDPWNQDAMVGVKHAASGWIDAGAKGEPARAIAESDEARFGPFRDALAAVVAVLDALAGDEGGAGVKKLLKEDKAAFLAALRAELPDAALEWLDAVAAVGDDVVYTRLLGGSGGNDGRQEYSRHFLVHLSHALGFDARPASRERRRSWLEAALHGMPTQLLAESPGLLFPGQADMPAGPVENTLVNPWDFVLALEGVPVFASGVSRRHRAGWSSGSAPFTVRPVAAGDPSGASGEDTHEFWAPRWEHPATYGEIVRLTREGRCEWQRRQAGDGLDAVRAVRALGVDRGIDSFVRYSVAKRRGQSRLAYAAGRVGVREDRRVGILAEVDPHLRRLRGDRPAAVEAAARVLEEAVWEAADDGRPAAFQNVLAALAEVDGAVSRSGACRDTTKPSYVPPVSGLSPSAWLAACDDETPEVRLAAALAAQYEFVDSTVHSIRQLVRPVRWRRGSWRPEWSDTTPVTGLGVRPLVAVLADVLMRRVIEVEQAGRAVPGGVGGDDVIPTVGIQPAFDYRRVGARLGDVADFVRGLVDETRLERLFAGFVLLDWWRLRDDDLPDSWPAADGCPRPPLAYAVLAPFFTGRAVGRGGPLLVPDGTWPAALVMGDTARVLTEAHLRWRMARRQPAFSSPAIVAGEVDSVRLAAALLVPLDRAGERRVVDLAVTENGDRETGGSVDGADDDSSPISTTTH